MNTIKEHQSLLIRRESKDVLGRRALNLWILAAVLTATFTAISFSKASTAYLEKRMNDPFTNWVNIDLSEYSPGDTSKLLDSLRDTTISRRYAFDAIQTEVNSDITLVYSSNSETKTRTFKTLLYEDLTCDFIAAVLDESNIIGKSCISLQRLTSQSLGIILTQEAMSKLGYDNPNDYPAFVDFRCNSEGADTIGIPMVDDVHARSPLPLIAVVNRLPMNKQVLAAKLIDKMRIIGTDDEKACLNLNRIEYARDLCFFIPKGALDSDSASLVSALTPTYVKYLDWIERDTTSMPARLSSWKEGQFWHVWCKDDVPLETVNAIRDTILERLSTKGIVRLYDYKKPEDDVKAANDNVISAHLLNLNTIDEFNKYLKDTFDLQIEMTQVNQRKNFAAVSTMANILTVALIVFSIIAIVIFIVNMMQSYFQKVKRNLGTFKAFGISTRELIMVYMTIIVGIVIAALAIALGATWCCELTLNALDITKPDGSAHLDLWNARTLWAIVIIMASTVLSVLTVMRRLLRHTPGDLIYDR